MRYNTDQKNSNEHFSRSVLFLRIATIYSIYNRIVKKTGSVQTHLLFSKTVCRILRIESKRKLKILLNKGYLTFF